ncbi:MAG: O-antigen ligase domain-containing protein [Proteobacteria bacterium]|nr:O-antigen ligase domain-containing protein [Pseudomonadota bacterium]
MPTLTRILLPHGLPTPAGAGRQSWRVAFAACLLLPWMLVFSRSLAEACLALSSVAFLWRSYAVKDWQWLRDPFCRIGFLAWAWMLLVSPFAANISGSFGLAAAWIRWVLLYASLRHFALADGRAVYVAGLNIVLLMAVVLIDTWWQYAFGISLSGNTPNVDYRLTGPLDNVKVGIFIAKLSFPSAAIMWFWSARRGSRRGQGLSLAYLGACIFTVMLSGERTATFSSLLAVCTIVLPLLWLDAKHRRLYLGLLLTSLAALFGLLATQTVLQDRLATLSHILGEFPNSAYGQLIWVGYKLGVAHPWFGAGLKGFRELCLPFLESGQVTHCNLHPHNPYVEWFAELGVMGLALLLALIIALARLALRHVGRGQGARNVPALFLLALLVLHFFPFMATQSIFSNWPAMLLWYSISIGVSALNMLHLSHEKPA